MLAASIRLGRINQPRACLAGRAPARAAPAARRRRAGTAPAASCRRHAGRVGPPPLLQQLLVGCPAGSLLLAHLLLKPRLLLVVVASPLDPLPAGAHCSARCRRACRRRRRHHCRRAPSRAASARGRSCAAAARHLARDRCGRHARGTACNAGSKPGPATEATHQAMQQQLFHPPGQCRKDERRRFAHWVVNTQQPARRVPLQAQPQLDSAQAIAGCCRAQAPSQGASPTASHPSEFMCMPQCPRQRRRKRLNMVLPERLGHVGGWGQEGLDKKVMRRAAQHWGLSNIWGA